MLEKETKADLKNGERGSGMIRKRIVVGEKKALVEKVASIPDITSSPRKGTLEEGLAKGLYDTWGTYLGVVRTRQILTYDQLRRIYLQSATVRACVDSIVRSIATTPWQISPVEKGNYDKGHLEEVEKFFLNPNRNKENWQQIMAKWLNDILVIDAGVIEKVKNPFGKLLEVFARDGATFTPDVDTHGIVSGYKQRVSAAGPVVFSNDEIIYVMLYPRSDTVFGTPIIESVVDEVATLLFSSVQVAKSFTEDEIPDGILDLGEIGTEAYDRAKEDFTEKKGITKDFQIRVVRGKGEKKWIPFKRPFKDMQMLELRESVERIIYRNFGVMPVEMGVTEGMPRAVAKEQLRVSESKLTYPIMQLLTYFINTEIIVGEFGYSDVKFGFIKVGVPTDKDKSTALKTIVTTGIMTPNEARVEIGLKPYEDKGDRALIIVGQNLYFLDDLEKGIKKPIGPEGGIGEPVEEVEEEGEESESELAEGLEEKRGPPNSIDLSQVRGLAKDYEQEMRSVWEEGKVKILKVMEKETEESLKRVDELVLGVNEEFVNLQKTYFPIAFYFGQEIGRSIFGRGGSLTESEDVSKALGKRYEWNEKFLKDSLFKDLRDDIKTVFKSRREGEKREYPLDNYGNAFLNKEARLHGYSGAMNGMVNEGTLVEYAAGFEEVLAYWHSTSGRPCPDCDGLEVGSPYIYSRLEVLPGDGSTACDGYCWCNIVLWRSGDPRIPTTLKGTPLLEYIKKIAPRSAPAGKGVKVSESDRKVSDLRAMDAERHSEIRANCLKGSTEYEKGKVEHFFENPYFREVFNREEQYRFVKTVRIANLSKEGLAGSYTGYNKVIMLDGNYVNLSTFTHEFAHSVTGQEMFGFFKTLPIKPGYVTTWSAPTPKVLESYKKGCAKLVGKLRRIPKPSFQRLADAFEKEVIQGTPGFFDNVEGYWHITNSHFQGCLRGYAYSAPTEYLCSGFEQYVTNPVHLKKVDASLYEIINSFVKEGRLK